MRIALIFYSFSGNTREANIFLKEKFSKQGHEISFIEIKPKEEEESFFGQGKIARARQTPELAAVDNDVSKYDLVVFSSPVWAFTFAPALRTYLKEVKGLTGRKTAVFLTCGAAVTSGRALEKLKDTVRGKGAEVIFADYVAGQRSRDVRYLEARFRGLLD
jgi:multimeric flavodoxin WrbA